MDALILAAGFGSRLQEVEPCKPLTKLYGLTLLEISILQLASVGASRIVVATGYRSEDIEAALPAIASKANVQAEVARVADCTKPNGYSVLAGSERFSSDFFLVMADHVLSRAVLQALTTTVSAQGETTLAIDRNVSSPLVDPDDATWVETAEDGRIRRIGKDITPYNAVDCGAFRASPALPAAIRAALDDGLPGSLSDGMQYLANDGLAVTVDIGNAWWMDVDDAHALKLAKSQIRTYLPDLFDHDDLTEPAGLRA